MRRVEEKIFGEKMSGKGQNEIVGKDVRRGLDRN
jgi:hypothetical protein